MKIRFWGVRGSHPTPITPQALKRKIAAVVQRITTEDLKSQENRELFLANLPDWVLSTPGGNTPCIEVRGREDEVLIFDAGTGIVELAKSLKKEFPNPKIFHIFLSHFHYDHIQGLPFFPFAYDPNCELHFYSPESDLEYNLKDHMRHPFFPITMEEKMTPKLFFHKITPDEKNIINSLEVTAHLLSHPGRAYAYSIQDFSKKKLIIATDYEISEKDIIKNNSQDFFSNAEVLILDTMYTLDEAIEKFSWGHSSFSMGVDFAIEKKIKQLWLFHHEPQYDDKRLYANLRNAEWYAQRQKDSLLAVYLAEEGIEISL